jgi:ribosomal protein S18 acetylase RimI-like enzyme
MEDRGDDAFPFTLRPATPADRAFLFDLTRTTMRGHVEAIWGIWDEAWQRARFEGKFLPEHWRVIECGGVAAGGLEVEEKPGPPKAPAELFLANLLILPPYQGRGAGSWAVRTVLAEGAARNLPVTLTVLRTNGRARRLYERLGFTAVRDESERTFMVAGP